MPSRLGASATITSDELVERDRQLSDSLAGGIVDRVGYRSANAGDADLADAARA